MPHGHRLQSQLCADEINQYGRARGDIDDDGIAAGGVESARIVRGACDLEAGVLESGRARHVHIAGAKR
jgi:hypothetical protein